MGCGSSFQNVRIVRQLVCLQALFEHIRKGAPRALVTVMKRHMRTLVQGFERFKGEVFPAQRSLFRELSKGQRPKALFITCSDSRVVPEVITQSRPGDLFICRTVGNQVPPHGESIGYSVASSIEYSVQVLGVRQIVICGHTDCGAMHGVLRPEKLTSLPSTAAWLRHTAAAREAVMAKHFGSAPGRNEEKPSESELVCRLAEANVVAQMEHLKTHPLVADLLDEGDLAIDGWVYQLHSGDIHAYDPVSSRFIPLQETYGTRTAPRKLKTACAGGSWS
jgi:carbonic anhydrase